MNKALVIVILLFCVAAQSDDSTSSEFTTRDKDLPLSPKQIESLQKQILERKDLLKSRAVYGLNLALTCERQKCLTDASVTWEAAENNVKYIHPDGTMETLRLILNRCFQISLPSSSLKRGDGMNYYRDTNGPLYNGVENCTDLTS